MNKLTVPVDTEFTVDAGTWEERPRDGTTMRVIYPPHVPIFQQTVEYLNQKPDPGPAGTATTNLGIVALCLRWGSYLAVLLDRTKPLWQNPGGEYGRIEDSEMARINIEITAALAWWIELYRSDAHTASAIANKAARFLPMTRKTAPATRRAHDELLPLYAATRLTMDILWGLREATPAIVELFDRRMTEIRAHPDRVLANCLINRCYRNGEIEQLHGGPGAPDVLPLTRRRITPTEERWFIAAVSEKIAHAVTVIWILHDSRRPWVEAVAPFHLLDLMMPLGGLYTAPDWSLTEQDREVWLYGSEPTSQ